MQTQACLVVFVGHFISRSEIEIKPEKFHRERKSSILFHTTHIFNGLKML